MNLEKTKKPKKLRAIKSKISQRSWRHPERTRHHKNLLYPIPSEIKAAFREECVKQQDTMRDAVIKLLRFYIWNEGCRMPPLPKYKKYQRILVMCIPETTKISFKAQCILQMESMKFALINLLRYYIKNHGVPDGPSGPERIPRNDAKKDERRRAFEYARKYRAKTARSSLNRGMDTA